MSFILTDELTQQIVNYLAGRPYVEVADLIAGVLGSEKKDESEKGD